MKEIANTEERLEELKVLSKDFVKAVGGIFFPFTDIIDNITSVHDFYLVENLIEFINKSKNKVIKQEELEKVIKKMETDPYTETKRLMLALGKISDGDKINYFSNLYNNYLNGLLYYDLFLNYFYFLEDANIFEINAATSLYLGKEIESELTLVYIKTLEKYGLIDIQWGSLSGISTNSNNYYLNEYGINAVTNFYEVCKEN